MREYIVRKELTEFWDMKEQRLEVDNFNPDFFVPDMAKVRIEGARNALTDVDLEKIHEQLKMQKKNITAVTADPSKLSRKTLGDAYKNWHNWESRMQSLTHSSNENMLSANLKNEFLKTKFKSDLKQINEQEQLARNMSNKKAHAVREDMASMMAYGYVYKKHSFRHCDDTRSVKSPSKILSELNIEAREIRKPPVGHKLRPLGILRGSEKLGNQPMKLPAIPHSTSSSGTQTPDPTYQASGKGMNDSQIFPKIQEHFGVTIKYKNSEEEIEIQDEVNENRRQVRPANAHLGLINSLVLWKQDMDRREKLARERRENLKTLDPHHQQYPLPMNHKDGWRRVLPPPRPKSTILGEASTPIAMRKKVSEEVDEILYTWSPPGTQENTSTLRDKQKNPVPRIIRRTRSTSAIYREYKKFQAERKEEERPKTEKPLLIRQMSPVPREIIVRSKTEIGRSVSPTTVKSGDTFKGSSKTGLTQSKTYIKRPISPTTMKTDTDRYTSVTSIRIPYEDDSTDTEMDPEIQLNALLTAAERIEKEKQKVQKMIEDRAAERVKADIQRGEKLLNSKRDLSPRITDLSPLEPKQIQNFDCSSSIISKISENLAFNANASLRDSDRASILSKSTALTGLTKSTTQMYQIYDKYKRTNPRKLPKKPKIAKAKMYKPTRLKPLQQREAGVTKTTEPLVNNMKLKYNAGDYYSKDNDSDMGRPPTRVSFNENVTVYNE